jgi:butyryl-CoA dehydrogenase
MIKEMVRNLAAEEIAPIAAEIDESGRFPKEIIQKMVETDLLGIIIPRLFGGSEGTILDFLLVVEEIAAVSASIGLSFLTSTTVAFLILTFGNNEQKKKYLPPLVKGEKLGAIAITEPSSGTNWQMTIRTNAIFDNNQYVVNGSKCLITNVGEADIFIVVARTNVTEESKEFSIFIIENETPGFSFGRIDDKLGLRANPTGEIFFENCMVPKENILGIEGEVSKILQALSAFNCTGHAAICVGIAQAALNASIKYIKERIVHESTTLANYENVQSSIANMTVVIEAARLLAFRAAIVGADPLTIMAAIYGNDVAINVTGKAVELYGGYGCLKDFSVERYFRDAKTLSLHKTSDYVRATVGKKLLDKR